MASHRRSRPGAPEKGRSGPQPTRSHVPRTSAPRRWGALSIPLLRQVGRVEEILEPSGASRNAGQRAPGCVSARATGTPRLVIRRCRVSLGSSYDQCARRVKTLAGYAPKTVPAAAGRPTLRWRHPLQPPCHRPYGAPQVPGDTTAAPPARRCGASAATGVTEVRRPHLQPGGRVGPERAERRRMHTPQLRAPPDNALVGHVHANPATTPPLVVACGLLRRSRRVMPPCYGPPLGGGKARTPKRVGHNPPCTHPENYLPSEGRSQRAALVSPSDRRAGSGLGLR